MKIHGVAHRAVVRSLGRTAVVVLALIGLLAPAVAAQTGGGSDSTGRTLAEFTAELGVPGFDSSLGTLVSADLSLSADIDSRVLRVTNDSSATTDIWLTTELGLCAQSLGADEFMTYDSCSIAGGGVTTNTEINSESFQGVTAGGNGSRLTPVTARASTTSVVLDPTVLRSFVDVESVRIGVASKQSHQTLGGYNPDPNVETFVNAEVSISYSYIAIDLEVVDGGYQVTSTGTTTLSGVSVLHDTAGEICSVNLLPPGQSHRCEVPGGSGDAASATATAVAAMNPGVSTTSGVSAGSDASLQIEVATNGVDADITTGPKVQAGDLITWTYVISNTGTDDLVDVAVSDDRTGAICVAATLAAGTDFDCTHEGRATSGQNSMTAKAVGTSTGGALVSDTDPTHHIVVNQDGTPTTQLATGGGSAAAPLEASPYAGVQPPKLAFTGAETTVAAVIGASSLLLGLACVGASGRLRRRHGIDD